MAKVIIGVDPHKLSATIEVVDSHEKLLGSGRFSTDRPGYTAMRAYAKTWPERVWAVEGSNGAGRPLAQRLLEAGEHVVDVPAKLAARVRLFDTGHNRKTDARDAHSIAIVAVRTKTLRVLRLTVSSKCCPRCFPRSPRSARARSSRRAASRCGRPGRWRTGQSRAASRGCRRPRWWPRACGDRPR